MSELKERAIARLKLGPIPDDKPVRRTIVLSVAQDALLRDYAQALAAQEGMTALPACAFR